MSHTNSSVSISWFRDLCTTLLALAAVVSWDFSGGDWLIAQHYGHATGFTTRHAMWATELHNAGRWLALAAWAALLAWAVWPRPGSHAPARATTVTAALMVVVAALLVAVIKRSSGAECPWSLQAFGGAQPYLSHWTAWSPRAGAGQCFPSGHASAALAFLPVYGLWRGQHRRLARITLWVTLALGAVYGWLQVARGAHFVSHVLWSAWLCWLVALASSWLMPPLLLRWTPWRISVPPRDQSSAISP